jgi:hypothetical protein
MKLNPVILIIVVVLAVSIGLNLNNESTVPTKEVTSSYADVGNVNNSSEQKLTEEEKKEGFKNFYQNIYKFVLNFEEIDKATSSLAEQNPSRIQQHEFFDKTRQVMEEGQMLPLTSLIPKGFNKSQIEIMKETTTELDHAFQYRKFGYEHYLEYLETGSPKTYNTSKEWINSANSSLQTVIINLEVLKEELGYDDIEVESNSK